MFDLVAGASLFVVSLFFFDMARESDVRTVSIVLGAILVLCGAGLTARAFL